MEEKKWLKSQRNISRQHGYHRYTMGRMLLEYAQLMTQSHWTSQMVYV